MRLIMNSLIVAASLLCGYAVACTSAEETCNQSRVAAHEAWSAARATFAESARSTKAAFERSADEKKAAESALDKKEMWTPVVSISTDPEVKRLREAANQAEKAWIATRKEAGMASSLLVPVEEAVAASALSSALQSHDALTRIRPTLPTNEAIARALTLSDAAYEACKNVSP